MNINRNHPPQTTWRLRLKPIAYAVPDNFLFLQTSQGQHRALALLASRQG